MTELAFDIPCTVPELQDACLEDLHRVVNQVTHLLLHEVMHVAFRQIHVGLLACANATIQLFDPIVLGQVVQDDERPRIKHLVDGGTIVLIRLLVVVTGHHLVQMLLYRVVHGAVHACLHHWVRRVQLAAAAAHTGLEQHVDLHDVAWLLEPEGTFWVFLCPFDEFIILRIVVLFLDFRLLRGFLPLSIVIVLFIVWLTHPCRAAVISNYEIVRLS